MNAPAPPHTDREFAARDGPWLGFALLLAGTAVVGLWLAPQRINHDCALYLQQAELLLDGAVPYCDFVDTNPPLIVYLNVLPAALARTCGVPVIPAFHGLVVALLMFSGLEISRVCACTHAILRKNTARACKHAPYLIGLAPAGRGLVLIAWLALYFVVDLHGDAGQREHLFVLLYVPYLFLRILRYRGGSVPGWLAALLGVQAGIGAALKPHFLLAAAGVEVALLLTSRRQRTIVQPENIALAAVLAAYAAHWLFVPAAMREAFFGRWLPLVRRGYGAYNASYREVAETILRSPISLVALAAALASAILCIRRRTRLRHHFAALAALAGLALTLVFVQQKGWSYHRIPLDAAGLLCLALLGAEGGRGKAEGGGRRENPKSKIQNLALSSLPLLAGVALVILLAVWFTGRESARPDPPAFDALRRIVEQRTRPGDRVLVIATSVRPAYPMLLQTGRKPGSRYFCSFPLALFYASGESAKADRPMYRRRHEAPAEEQQFLDELRDDVARLRPRLILIPDSPGWQGLPAGFNTYAYLVYSGWAEDALASYRELPGPKGWKVFGP